ncbi:SH3 domain-containing protein [Ramlibacter sp. AW1]|uniref:SH3 domain-containing protein n=1 Tax=Ramlibacter aurantiacus TaxID=2801330 RepID=A0A936ZKT3_9BURK|nr:SH3 domain-containing protein [Ramlibacter aurantiacus]MBL0419050.1 SH3 domain-containing protein [Ramlibacter aurantiacus]
MHLYQMMRKTLAGLAMVTAAVVAPIEAARAQALVSIRGENVNLRAAPTKRSEVKFLLGSGYPLKVIGRRGSWLHVVDFENDRGWVARSLTSRKRFSIVKSPSANVRSGPGTRYRVIEKASYGDVFQVLDRRQGWVRVKLGKRPAWVARSLLWGP